VSVGDGRIAPSGEQVEISFRDHRAAVVEVGGGLRSYLMLFTGDTSPDVNRRSLAVEPMSCPPNAFRTGDSLIRLEPSESATATWGISPT
jgi:aldose 1-epimerase